MTHNKDIIIKLVSYFISVALIIASFMLPPTGEISPSVLMATGLLLGGYELIFGTSIRVLHIDKTGVHIELEKYTDNT